MRLSRKKRVGKNAFEASMLVDNADVKIVTASYKRNPFIVGIGTSKQRKVKGSGQAGFPQGVKGAYQTQKEYDWQVLYNPNALPPSFIPLEKTKDLMDGTIAVTADNATIYSPSTEYKKTTLEELRKLNTKLASIKHTTDILSFFETEYPKDIKKKKKNNVSR